MYHSRFSLIVSAVALAALVALARLSGHGLGRPGPEGQVLDDLVTANRILADRGILDGYGHVSARSPKQADRFFLSRAKAPALVVAADILEYDLAGRAVSATGRPDYIERYIHAAIYRARPDVRAVVHAHTPSLVAFADSSVPMRAMSHMSSFLAGGVPVFDVGDVATAGQPLVADASTGRALAGALGDRAVVLMRNHGVVIVAGSLPSVVSRSVYLDLNAKIQARAIALGGTVTYLEPAAPHGPTEEDGVGGYDRDWELWKRQAGR